MLCIEGAVKACYPYVPTGEDLEAIRAKIRAFNERDGVRVGDFVKLANGNIHRVAYDWTERRGEIIPRLGSVTLQFARHLSDGRFCLEGNSRQAFCDYSGALDPTITLNLAYRGHTMPGIAWSWGEFNDPGKSISYTTSFRLFTEV